MAQVSFAQIPQNVRVPFVYVEVDSARGGAPSASFRSLMIGQKLAAGNVAELTPTIIGDPSAADAAFGAGSQLALMVAAFRRQNPLGELWAIAIDDAGWRDTKRKPTLTFTAATGNVG